MAHLKALMLPATFPTGLFYLSIERPATFLPPSLPISSCVYIQHTH